MQSCSAFPLWGLSPLGNILSLGFLICKRGSPVAPAKGACSQCSHEVPTGVLGTEPVEALGDISLCALGGCQQQVLPAGAEL